MSYPYIPANTKVVCTFQTDASPKELIVTRENPTVGKKSENVPLLTVKDLNINQQFACKSPAISAASFLAFGAGLIAGILLFSNPVGWVIAAIAVVAIAATAYQVSQIKHKCTPGLESGKWALEHKSVYMDGNSAITQGSILICDVKGILTPILDPAIAERVAREIANNNKKEIGVNAFVSFIGGILLPSGVSGIAAQSTLGLKIWGGVKMGAGIVAGMAIIRVATWGQRELTREYALQDNEYYDRMNREDGNSLFEAPDKPSDFDDLGQAIAIQEAIRSGNLASQNVQLQNRLDHIAGLSRPQLYRDPVARELLAELKQGKHPELRAAMINFNNRRMNPTMREQMNTTNRQNLSSNLKNMTSKGVGAVAFFAPFLSTYFSEEARKSLAEAMLSDAQTGGSIVANNPG